MDDHQKSLSQIWELGLGALRWLGEKYDPVLKEAARKEGLVAPAWYAWLLPALTFEPEAISTEKLRVRSPYTAPGVYEERLANAAAAGYLRCVDRDGYMLTLKGHNAVRAVLQAGDACMEQLRPMQVERMEMLAGLLRQLVDSSLAAPEPPGRWGLAHSRMIDRGSGAPIVVRIDQYLSDISAYRDDCHLAAWAPLGIDGPEMEALTYIWRTKEAEPLTFDELYDALRRRGWGKDDYLQRLADLVQRSWVEQSAQAYKITLAGWTIRQAVEQKTDEYFYRPWACLTAEEMESLKDLLAAMGDTNMTKG